MALTVVIVVGIVMTILELISTGVFDKISWKMYVAFLAFGLALGMASNLSEICNG